jgi:hypothetical protein
MLFILYPTGTLSEASSYSSGLPKVHFLAAVHKLMHKFEMVCVAILVYQPFVMIE